MVAYDTKYGKAVSMRRLSLGLTQRQLSILADIHPTTIPSIEKYGYAGSKFTVNKIAEALGVKPTDLMDEKVYNSLRDRPKHNREAQLPSSRKDQQFLTLMKYARSFDEKEMEQLLHMCSRIMAKRPPR